MKSFKTNRIIFSVGAVLIGIILLIWPASSLMIIAKTLGVLLAAGGIASGVFYFKDHQSIAKTALLVMGVIMVVCGVVIFLHPEELVKLIPTIMGILVLLSGIINLGETFALTKQKYSRWWISLAISVVTIAAGVFLVVKAFDLVAIITRIAGGILIFDGLSDLWVTSRISTEPSKEPVDSVIVSEEKAKTEEAAAAKAEPGPAETAAASVKPEAEKASAPKAAEPAPAPETVAAPEEKATEKAEPEPAAHAEKEVKKEASAENDVELTPEEISEIKLEFGVTETEPEAGAEAEQPKGDKDTSSDQGS